MHTSWASYVGMFQRACDEGHSMHAPLPMRSLHHDFPALAVQILLRLFHCFGATLDTSVQ